MIAAIIIILLAFAWLGYESDYMRIRLESTEYQRAQKAKAKTEFGNTSMGSKVNADMPKDTKPYRPSEFTPLDMPELAGSLNIICKRGQQNKDWIIR